jgi:hypothetical protein
MIRLAFRLLVGALVVLALSVSASAQSEQRFRSTATGMIIKFQNLRPDAATVPAYICFGGGKPGTPFDVTNLADNTPIVRGCSQDQPGYKISDLSKGVRITHYDSGRIFISIGSGLTAGPGNDYTPNFANPNLADFTTRWDKIEITFVPNANGVGSSGGANLTSQDFFGIPLEITTSGGTVAPANLTWHANTAAVFEALGKLSNFAVSTPQNATGAIGLGNDGVPVEGVSGGNVVRVISPASVAPTDGLGGHTVYPSLASYVSYLRTGNATTPNTPIVTHIAGANGQFGNGIFQVYDLEGTVSNSSYTINGHAIAPGDAVLNGTTVNDSGTSVSLAIQFLAKNLTDHDIYGAAPAYTIIEGGDLNGIVAKVQADYFSALNFGLAGSTVANPNVPGSSIGNSPSWTWYGNQPDGLPFPKLPVVDAFAKAQPGNPSRYNQYAAYLVNVTDSYGFAYNDRLETPLASLTDDSTLVLSILSDTLSTGDESVNPAAP